MEKAIILAIWAAFLVTGNAVGQNPDSTKKSQEEQKSSLRRNTRKNKLDNLVRMDKSLLPEAVLTTLRSSERYFDWEKSPIYKSKEEDMFVVVFKRGTTTKEYMFRRNGKEIHDN